MQGADSRKTIKVQDYMDDLMFRLGVSDKLNNRRFRSFVFPMQDAEAYERGRQFATLFPNCLKMTRDQRIRSFFFAWTDKSII